MDIHWWMDTVGQLDERYDEVDDLARARRLPSLQLVGTPERRTLELNTVAAQGVQLVGRLVGRSGDRAQFSGSLANVCASADLKQQRLLDRLDDYAPSTASTPSSGRFGTARADRVGRPPLDLDLRSIGTIVWATGFRPTYPWLDESLLDARAPSTTAVCCRRPASTSSASRSCGGASPASSTASARTRSGACRASVGAPRRNATARA